MSTSAKSTVSSKPDLKFVILLSIVLGTVGLFLLRPAHGTGLITLEGAYVQVYGPSPNEADIDLETQAPNGFDYTNAWLVPVGPPICTSKSRYYNPLSTSGANSAPPCSAYPSEIDSDTAQKRVLDYSSPYFYFARIGAPFCGTDPTQYQPYNLTACVPYSPKAPAGTAQPASLPPQ